MRQNSIAKISGLSNISCHIFVGSILTLKDNARDPTVDLSRLNTIRRTIRKVMGVGKKQKTKNHGREVTEKKIVQRRSEGKMSCRVNCSVVLIALHLPERQLGSHLILQL